MNIKYEELLKYLAHPDRYIIESVDQYTGEWTKCTPRIQKFCKMGTDELKIESAAMKPIFVQEKCVAWGYRLRLHSAFSTTSMMRGLVSLTN